MDFDAQKLLDEAVVVYVSTLQAPLQTTTYTDLPASYGIPARLSKRVNREVARRPLQSNTCTPRLPRKSKQGLPYSLVRA